jgi:hypothetical protein
VTSGSVGAGIINVSTGNVIIVGNILGDGINAVANSSTGTITITGNITSSSVNAGGYGVNNASTGTVTLTNNASGCNIINTSVALALIGKPFVWSPLPTNYIQFGSTKFYPVTADTLAKNIFHDKVIGGVTGTLAASNIATAVGSGDNVTTANLLTGNTVDDVAGAANSAGTGRVLGSNFSSYGG